MIRDTCNSKHYSAHAAACATTEQFVVLTHLLSRSVSGREHYQRKLGSIRKHGCKQAVSTLTATADAYNLAVLDVNNAPCHNSATVES